ncbi:MAG: hypothetical protein ACYC5M_02060 [Anaerolineae bacterium]
MIELVGWLVAASAHLWLALAALCIVLGVTGCAGQMACELFDTPSVSGPPSSEAAARLEARVSAALATDGHQSVIMTDREAFSYLAPRLAASTLRLHALRFQPGAITIEGYVGARRPMLLRVAADVQAADGSPQVIVRCAMLDGRALPRWIACSLEAIANAALADAHIPWHMECIHVGEGTLQVSGSTR